MKTIPSICCLLTLLALSGEVALAQSGRTGTTYTVLVTPQASLTRIGADALGSGGASVAEKGLATAAFTNPANMHFDSFTAYAEFGKYTTSEWAVDFDYNGQFVAPTVLSVGLPLEGFSLGLSYLRQYSNHMTVGPISITTPEFPDGTGESMTFENSVDLHSLCGSASVALNNMVSLGLTVGGNYFHWSQGLGTFSVLGTSKSFFGVGGITVALDENVSVAASARYNSSTTFTPEVNPPIQLLDPRGRYGYTVEEPSPVEVRFPPICEMGVSWQALPEFKLLASTEFQNWTTALPDAENRWQFHVGGVVDATEVLALRFGFFTLSNPTAYNQDVLDQQFLTLGFQLKLEQIRFSLAMMDSHLFKKSVPADSWTFTEPFYQTYFASGVSLAF